MAAAAPMWRHQRKTVGGRCIQTVFSYDKVPFITVKYKRILFTDFNLLKQTLRGFDKCLPNPRTMEARKAFRCSGELRPHSCLVQRRIMGWKTESVGPDRLNKC